MTRYKKRFEELTPTLYRWWLADAVTFRMAADGVESSLTWALAAADRRIAELEAADAPVQVTT